MNDLPVPPQVLLDIISFCNVPTLKSLRLTQKSILTLIDVYQISISADIRRLSFTPSDIVSFQPIDHSPSALQALFSLDYRVRTTRWLTDVALENCSNIGTNDRQGDPLRERIKVGWSVLWRLSDIAQQETTDYNLKVRGWCVGDGDEGQGMGCEERATQPPTDTTNSVQDSETLIILPSSPYCPPPMNRSNPLYKLEAVIQNKRKTYISTLSFDNLYSYCLLEKNYLAAAFCGRVFVDPREDIPDWETVNESEVGFDYNMWLQWFVLREGPKFFAKAWASREGNEECVKLIKSESSKRAEEQELIESSAALEVVRHKLKIPEVRCFPGHPRLNWMSYAHSQHNKMIEREHRDVVFHLGRHLSEEVIRRIEIVSEWGTFNEHGDLVGVSFT